MRIHLIVSAASNELHCSNIFLDLLSLYNSYYYSLEIFL